jgi:hypothetical protein|tara:strand:+ start:1107 stop:1349 length:243 start_codon:yes stop_codon:yes gene_type:complete
MASVTNWIEHLTTDVDAVTEGVQVGDIYPMVGTEWMWLTVAIVFWLWFHISQGTGEAEEQQKLARKRPSANDYKKNIAEW